MTSSRLRLEHGYAVVTALVLTTLMLTIGLASLAFVDTEQKQSGRERERESRLNLTEGALSSQIFLLSRNWPESALSAYPASCDQASSDPKCPNATQLKSHFSAVDFKLNPTWTVQVVDNPGTPGRFYSDSLLTTAAKWDQSGPLNVPDGEMWVRAEGRLDGRKRVVVARVRVEKESLPLPANSAFVAGTFESGNSGNKVIVNGGGIVRCPNGANGADPPSHKDNDCEGFDPGQVVGAVKPDPNTPASIMDGAALASLRSMAKSRGTYYPDACANNPSACDSNGCPKNPSGEVVFVEQGDCKYQAGMVVNSQAMPGMFIVNNGTVLVNGNVTWYGIIYGVNAQKSTGTVVEASGNSDIRGAIYVDGAGRLTVGQSKTNLTYDQAVTQTRYVYGTAGIIQNTWRELIAG
jgi:hypothetical protein